MTTIDVDHFRDLLLEERERLQNAIEYLHEENEGSLEDEIEEIGGSSDNHLVETASATVDREIDFTLEEQTERVLEEIDRAVKRIEDGTYGTCRTCGKQISPERLEAIPWATQCIDCKRREEHG